jgi:hypothetical protein
LAEPWKAVLQRVHYSAGRDLAGEDRHCRERGETAVEPPNVSLEAAPDYESLVVRRCSTGAKAVERKAHLTLIEDNRQLLGEWFDRSVDQAADIVEFAAEVLGIDLNTSVPDDVRQLINPILLERDRYALHVAETLSWRTGERQHLRDFVKRKPRGRANGLLTNHLKYAMAKGYIPKSVRAHRISAPRGRFFI